MSENPIQALMTTTMQSIRQMIEVSTVVGDPISAEDGSIIIPVTKVSFGFAASGVELQPKQPPQQGDPKFPFGGGSGCGAKIEPVAFLVICGGNIKLVPVKTGQNTLEKVLDLVPELVDKANNIFKEHMKKPSGKVKTTTVEKDFTVTD